MNDLRTLYDTNKMFQLYVNKFAFSYQLNVDKALCYRMVKLVSATYTPKKLG